MSQHPDPKYGNGTISVRRGILFCVKWVQVKTTENVPTTLSNGVPSCGLQTVGIINDNDKHDAATALALNFLQSPMEGQSCKDTCGILISIL